MTGIARIARFSLTTGDAERLGAFYENALGFARIGVERHLGPTFEELTGVRGGARGLVLGLGEEVVELLEFASSGRPYPQGAESSDLIFQHMAIVVAGMDAAYRRLSAVAGWSAITRSGPQHLPHRSGGVSAFKFRDPEGHPLELLEFPPDNWPPHWRGRRGGGETFLGVDHSAISVADVARSVAFYKALGLSVAARSFNHGPEQERLDGLSAAQVEVVALAPPQATPHVELLGYRQPQPAGGGLANNDIAATRLIFEIARSQGADALAPRALTDPDNHHLLLVAPPG